MMLVHAISDLVVAVIFYWYQWYTYDVIRDAIGPATAGLCRVSLITMSICSGLLSVIWFCLYFIHHP